MFFTLHLIAFYLHNKDCRNENIAHRKYLKRVLLLFFLLPVLAANMGSSKLTEKCNVLLRLHP